MYADKNSHDNDFANVLSSDGGLAYWQSLNWDSALSSNVFYDYCDVISNTSVLYPATTNKTSIVSNMIEAAGYDCSTGLVNQMLNYIGFVNLTEVASCAASDSTQDECFSEHNATFYAQDDLSQATWRSWPYQVCTQWGFFQTGSGVPADQLPLISRTIDLPYEELICNLAFNITSPPDTDIINADGGYNISYPRLAFIDGEWDPWRPATPHAWEFGALNRTSTVDQPFLLIPQAVHHVSSRHINHSPVTYR